ncbi:4Fe-4S dicluster domain-containing protein [Metallosphaera tengchongensis]|uniref:4Fe-4S dicluster domain-containing protein n=1 Tax=Metallosphaera tengchongensis TaxID=1532350 RepID=A0A6N0NY92_9CREN|nr:4Fe-4S dicluster domain-containing protein [Metallosphaera tengchongensis]QKR00101.1 4Fe-4S dicluster domain-containing protein [Metallosphaera tengchongensis]
MLPNYQFFPVSHPEEGAGGKTGNWRVVRPEVTSKCIGCNACFLWCPEGTIMVKGNKAEVNYVYCKGCGVCANVCPVKAITMVSEA